MSDQAIHASSKPKLCTPSDTAMLSYNGEKMSCRGVSFAVAGALAVKDDVGNTVIIPSGALAAGIIHPLVCSQILSSGTGATGIVTYF